MRNIVVAVGLLLLVQALAALAGENAMIQKSTPVFFTPSVEETGAFFEALGFARTIEVPEGDALGFAIYVSGGVEVMVQSHASLAKDMPHILESATGAPTFLYVRVSDLDAAAAKVTGYELYLSRRTTFYGATEIGFRIPGGHYVTLAQFAEEAGAK